MGWRSLRKDERMMMEGGDKSMDDRDDDITASGTSAIQRL